MFLSQNEIIENFLESANFYKVLFGQNDEFFILLLCQILKIRQKNCKVVLFGKLDKRCSMCFGGQNLSLKYHPAYYRHLSVFRKQTGLSTLHGASKIMETLPSNVSSEWSILLSLYTSN